jgi:hypothetical protein
MSRKDTLGRAGNRELSLFSSVPTEGHDRRTAQGRADDPYLPRREIATENATDPQLAAVIEAWDKLPEAVKAGIVATVKAACPAT